MQILCKIHTQAKMERMQMNNFSNVLYLKRRLRGDLIAVFSYLMGCYKEGVRLSLEAHSDGMKGKGHKGQHRNI